MQKHALLTFYTYLILPPKLLYSNWHSVGNGADCLHFSRRFPATQYSLSQLGSSAQCFNSTLYRRGAHEHQTGSRARQHMFYHGSCTTQWCGHVVFFLLSTVSLTIKTLLSFLLNYLGLCQNIYITFYGRPKNFHQSSVKSGKILFGHFGSIILKWVPGKFLWKWSQLVWYLLHHPHVPIGI